MADQVANQIPFVQYTANGATTIFGYAFEVPTAADMKVYADGVLVPESAYTLSGVGVQAGGSVTFLVAPVNGTRVLLNREVALQRTTGYQTLGDFRADIVNPDFNRLWMALQQFDAVQGGAIRVPYPGQVNELPDPANFDGYYIGMSGGHPTFLLAPSGTAGAVAGDIANTSDTAKGDALVGQKRTFTGAVATTPHAWHEKQVIDFAADLLADTTGAVDCTSLFQLAVTAGSVRVGPGTYTMSGDIDIPANRKIIVEKGATITNTGGRFTAYDVDNVEWHIDGWVKSVNMTTAADKTGWEAGSRGFIEFGDNYSAGQSTSGFWVHGTGKVSGNWTGTPNISDSTSQINRKGIACYNSKNVCVEGLEVFGFDGEAVYAFFFDAASKNIVFRNNYVHDTRFNGLNFNAATNGGGCFIHNNTVATCYQGIEQSTGTCSGNDIFSTVAHGIYTGSGAGFGPLVIRDNNVYTAGTVVTAHGIIAAFASGTPVTGVEIYDNTIVNASNYSIYTDYIREFSIRGNKCIGTGRLGGGYDIGINHALRGTVSANTFLAPGAFAQSARMFADANSFDVSMDPDSNIYLPTTGSATPKSGNGVQTLASATALLVPSLGSVFSVSGTTTITSIATALLDSNHAGRQITLIFQGALTFTDGSNLKLAGNFVTTADDTITLVCDGTNWFEKCRSVN